MSSEIRRSLSEDVGELLRAVGVTTVIVVDDEFEPSFEDLVAAGRAMGSARSQIDGIGLVDFGSEPEEWEETLRRAWRSLTISQKRRALDDLNRMSSTPPAEATELTVLHDLMVSVDFRRLGPEEWKVAKESVVGDAVDNPTLILFDQDLGDGDREGGLRLVTALYKLDSDGDIWAGLLTNTVGVESEGRAWDEIATQLGGAAERFILLSKKHLSGDAGSFSEALRLALMTQPAWKLRQSVAQRIADGTKSALKDLHRFGPAEFERIVFGLARDEGVWEVDILLRLFDIYLRSNVRTTLQNHLDHREVISRLRELDRLRRGPSNPISTRAQLIYRQEIYESSVHLCGLHLPLELGDLFRKENGQKQFVLVAQPCDLMVRKSGERCPALSFVTLLPIRTTDPNAEISGSRIPRTVFELPAFSDDGNPGWVELDRPAPVPVEALDYCILNKDGRGVAPLPSQGPEWLLPSWEKRRDILTGAAEKVRDSFNGLSRDDRVAVVKAHFGIRRDCIVKASMESHNFTLGLRRVGRILSPYARAILTSYCAHRARDAFDRALV